MGIWGGCEKPKWRLTVGKLLLGGDGAETWPNGVTERGRRHRGAHQGKFSDFRHMFMWLFIYEGSLKRCVIAYVHNNGLTPSISSLSSPFRRGCSWNMRSSCRMKPLQGRHTLTPFVQECLVAVGFFFRLALWFSLLFVLLSSAEPKPGLLKIVATVHLGASWCVFKKKKYTF